jgi:uncharacterized protein
LKRGVQLIKIVLVLLLALHVVVFLALAFQDLLIFRGKEVHPDYKFKILIPHQEFTWTDSSGQSGAVIHNVIYPPRGKVRGHIFYLHGTFKHVEYQTQYVPFFTERGYAVWMMDYRGYGKSRGKRTEQTVREDAVRMYDFFLRHFDIRSNEAIVVGRSIGAAIATQLAAERQPGKLALIAPFYNLPDLFKCYVPWFPFHLFMNNTFRNEEYLPQYKGEVAIFYGANDLVIPPSNTRKLLPLLKSGDEYHEYERGTHVNVTDMPDFQIDMEAFLKK